MRAALRPLLILAITVGLLALFFRQADFGQVWAQIRGADPTLLWAGVGCTVLTYVFRAWRWQYLLRPIGTTHFGVAFRTTVIGFAASFLLPARAGEVIRPYLLAREERLSATAAFATVLVERLLDLVTVLVCFAAFFLVYTPPPGLDAVAYRRVTVVGAAAAVGAVAALVMSVIVAGRPRAVDQLEAAAARLLPPRAAGVVGHVVARFAEGFGVMRDHRTLGVAVVLSLPLWMAIAGGIWTVTHAFHLDVSFPGTFLVMTILVVGVAAPTPGAVGGFHEAYRFATTTFFQADNDVAIGAALVLHVISFLPVTLLGVFFMARDGLNLGRMRQLARRGRSDEAPEPSRRTPEALPQASEPSLGVGRVQREGSK